MLLINRKYKLYNVVLLIYVLHQNNKLKIVYEFAANISPNTFLINSFL